MFVWESHLKLSLYLPKKACQDKQMKILWRKYTFDTLHCLNGLLECRKAEKSKAANKS